MIVAMVTAAVTAGGPALADGVRHALFAHNADAVDGKHAVGAGAKPAARAGKLVATNSAGRLPNNIIDTAPNSARLGGIAPGGFLRADGKAADADSLDNLDSTAFLRADGKAVDSDKLDGKDGNDLAVKTAFASGFGANPTSTLQFLVLPAQVTVGEGQAVHVTSNKAFGSSSAAGAHSLNLFICSRPHGSTATPAAYGGGSLGNRVAQNTRVTMGLSAVITDLSAGTYQVGLCGYSIDGANWNSNEYGYTSALVITTPSGAAASKTSVQSR